MIAAGITSAFIYGTGSAKALYSGNSNVLSNPFSLSQFPVPSPTETDPTQESPEETGENPENPEESKNPEETKSSEESKSTDESKSPSETDRARQRLIRIIREKARKIPEKQRMMAEIQIFLKMKKSRKKSKVRVEQHISFQDQSITNG